jgi:hypothetical protein
MRSPPGPKGSPRLKIAAFLLEADAAELSIKEALIPAGYKPKEITDQRYRLHQSRRIE